MAYSIRSRQVMAERRRAKAEAKQRKQQERRLALEEWQALTISADEVARQLGISRRTLQRWTLAGRLTPVRLGETDQSRLFYCRAEVEGMLGQAVG